MNGGMVPPKTTNAAPTKLGFVPADNRVYIDANWTAKDGVALIDNLFLGKVLGAGMQMSVAVLPESFGFHCIPVDALWAASRDAHPDADMKACPLLHGQIFELRDGSGRIAPIVLKVLKSGALIGDIEREWEAGQKVSQLADQDGNLPGFMKVGPALVRPDGKMVGQVLERLNGKSVSKAFSDKKFADIHYIRGMMLEVFTALDKAQRAFGFHHCDFRLENVMEHFPSREHNADDAVSIAVAGRPENRLYARQFKMIDYGLAKFDDLYCAAHGWLEQEAQGEAADGKMNDSVKLAFPEWIHHTAWKGKGDVYHLVFDVTQFIYGRVWPEEDKGEVELLLMLISHICGVRPKAWFRPDQKLSGSNASNVSNAVESRTASTKYAIPEKATTNVGKALQAYGKYSRVQRWGRKLKGWRWPHNPGITAAEILTSAFFYNPPGRGIDRPSSKVLSEDEVRLHK